MHIAQNLSVLWRGPGWDPPRNTCIEEPRQAPRTLKYGTFLYRSHPAVHARGTVRLITNVALRAGSSQHGKHRRASRACDMLCKTSVRDEE